MVITPAVQGFTACLRCGDPVYAPEGRKDAICRNCGYKLACCEGSA